MTPVTCASILEELRTKATARTKATYLRHGVAEPVLGVLTGEMEKVRKRLRTNHPLARELWNTEVFEARYLATLIADGKLISEVELAAWAESVKDPASAEALAGLAVRTPFRTPFIQAWTSSPREPLQRAGWSLLGRTLNQQADYPEADARTWVARIEGISIRLPTGSGAA